MKLKSSYEACHCIVTDKIFCSHIVLSTFQDRIVWTGIQGLTGLTPTSKPIILCQWYQTRKKWLANKGKSKYWEMSSFVAQFVKHFLTKDSDLNERMNDRGWWTTLGQNPSPLARIYPTWVIFMQHMKPATSRPNETKAGCSYCDKHVGAIIITKIAIQSGE